MSAPSDFIPPADVRAAGPAAERAWLRARAADARAASAAHARAHVPDRPNEVPQPRAASRPWGTPHHCVAGRGKPYSRMAPAREPPDPRAPRAAARTADIVQTVAAARAQHADPDVWYDPDAPDELQARVRVPGAAGYEVVPVTVDPLQLAAACAPPGGAVSVWATPPGGPTEHARVLEVDVVVPAGYVSREQMWRDRHAADELAEESLRRTLAERREAREAAEAAEREEADRRRRMYAEHWWYRLLVWAYRAARARASGHVYHADGRLAAPDADAPPRERPTPAQAALVHHHIPRHGGAKSVCRP